MVKAMLGRSLPCITFITLNIISHIVCLTTFQRLKQEHSHVFGKECDITGVAGFFGGGGGRGGRRILMLLQRKPVFVIVEMAYVGCIMMFGDCCFVVAILGDFIFGL
jgi:hypothetical protein